MNPLSPQDKIEFPRGRGLSPLWVIAVFVSFAETMLAIGVINTIDDVQLVLTIFLVVFTSFVVGAFFLVLWKKPYVFYPPREFGDNIDPEQYARAMQGHTQPLPLASELVEKKLDETLESKEMSQKLEEILKRLDPLKTEDMQKVYNELVKTIKSTASASIKQSFITLDSRPLLGDNGALWQEPYNSKLEVQAFLDIIYFRMSPFVASRGYGSIWGLRDRLKDQVFSAIGQRWASKVWEEYDNRAIQDVGIKEGAILEIVPIAGAMKSLFANPKIG